jgi:hypothetical protein
VPTLFEAIDAILLHEWDPIGIRGIAGCVDEYRSYVATVEHLVRTATEVEVADYLGEVVTKRMGLRGHRGHDERIARRLVELARTYATGASG